MGESKTVVRKIANHWQITCPCGYTWHTDHHRLAIMFATDHTHRAA